MPKRQLSEAEYAQHNMFKCDKTCETICDWLGMGYCGNSVCLHHEKLKEEYKKKTVV